jgi:hypothetical protein
MSRIGFSSAGSVGYVLLVHRWVANGRGAIPSLSMSMLAHHLVTPPRPVRCMPLTELLESPLPGRCGGLKLRYRSGRRLDAVGLDEGLEEKYPCAPCDALFGRPSGPNLHVLFFDQRCRDSEETAWKTKGREDFK